VTGVGMSCKTLNLEELSRFHTVSTQSSDRISTGAKWLSPCRLISSLSLPGAVVVAASKGAEGFAALDREFPVTEQEGSARGESVYGVGGREDSQQLHWHKTGPSLVETVMVVLLVLLAAGIWLRFNRSVALTSA